MAAVSASEQKLWFSVICRARFFKQLQVLEAVYIRTRDPVLCKQKENVVALTLFKYM